MRWRISPHSVLVLPTDLPRIRRVQRPDRRIGDSQTTQGGQFAAASSELLVLPTGFPSTGSGQASHPGCCKIRNQDGLSSKARPGFLVLPTGFPSTSSGQASHPNGGQELSQDALAIAARPGLIGTPDGISFDELRTGFSSLRRPRTKAGRTCYRSTSWLNWYSRRDSNPRSSP